jgi:hypothetical protein
LVDALDALFDAKIPAKWLKWSWESGALGTWFQGLLQRHKQLETWLTKGRPKAYWLTGFFNPQGFLTAMKQEVNRQHAKDKWALDDVVMTSEVTHPPQSLEKLKAAPNEGVYVYGLFLEGCTWDGKKNMLTGLRTQEAVHAPPRVVRHRRSLLGLQQEGNVRGAHVQGQETHGTELHLHVPAANGRSPEQVGHARRGAALLGGLKEAEFYLKTIRAAAAGRRRSEQNLPLEGGSRWGFRIHGSRTSTTGIVVRSFSSVLIESLYTFATVVEYPLVGLAVLCAILLAVSAGEAAPCPTRTPTVTGAATRGA